MRTIILQIGDNEVVNFTCGPRGVITNEVVNSIPEEIEIRSANDLRGQEARSLAINTIREVFGTYEAFDRWSNIYGPRTPYAITRTGFKQNIKNWEGNTTPQSRLAECLFELYREAVRRRNSTER